MSDQTSSKNDLDLEETTSWEVISEGNSSRSSSIENIVIDEFDKTKPEHIFVNISEKITNHIEKEEIEEVPSKFPKPDWKKLKSKAKKKLGAIDNFTALSIAASIFTITGLTLLFCLFPSATDKTSLEVIKKDYFEIIKGNTSHVPSAFNKTINILNKINNSSNYHEAAHTSEDLHVENEEVCPIEDTINETFINFNITSEEIEPEPSTSSDNYDMYIENATSNLITNIRDACLNPSVHLFLCSVMQDVCLIKFIQHLERKRTSTDKKSKPIQLNKKRASNKTKIEKKRKLLTKPEIFTNKSTTNNNNFENLRTENGKSECERRFEELETKWHFVGKNHRQKMHEIKEEFKTEISHMKGKEKEYTLRKQKIKSIRDKYVQRLKADRERYLLQLKKIKDERHKVMYEICRRKKIDKQPKATAAFDPGSTPKNLNKGVEETKAQSTVPPLQFQEYSKFWKNFSVPKIPKEKELDTNYLKGVISKLINLTESFEKDNFLPSIKPNKVPRKVFKKSKKEDSMSQYDSLNRNRSFLPTVTRIPSKASTINTRHLELEVKPSKKDTTQEKTCSFTTTALQSPSAAGFSQNKSFGTVKSVIVPFNSSSFSRMVIPKNESDKEQTKKDVLKSAKSDISSFKRGFNESYSFIPIRPKNLPKEILKADFNTSEKRSITLTNLLNRSNSLASKSEIVPPANEIVAIRSTKEENVEDKIPKLNYKLRARNSLVTNTIEKKTTLARTETPKKQDLYQLFFDNHGEKVKKQEEEVLENPRKKFVSPPPIQIMSKQDPKLSKKVYLFKGRL